MDQNDPLNSYVLNLNVRLRDVLLLLKVVTVDHAVSETYWVI